MNIERTIGQATNDQRDTAEQCNSHRRPFVTQCCSCGKVYDHRVWRRCEPVPGSLVTHTYCPNCLAEIESALHEMNSTVRG